ncbi:MAG: DUF3108 domain-containing protein [Pyrinomonadaceae bacterium]|nr:DUF3108 domain-containing protein [Pyrinomonadaceae bacterium]
MFLLALAPCAVADALGQSDVAAVPFSKAPYRVGERLTYNVSFSNFSTAAHVELFVAGRGTYFDREGFQLRAHVETIGIVNAALYSVNNDYVTYIAPETGQPFRSQMVRREGNRNEDFSREYNEPVGTEAIPARLRTGYFPGTYDLLSALYRVRALPLADGARYSFTVREIDVSYPVELKVIGRQFVKTNIGSFNTVITQLRFPKNSQANDYRIQIYFSDDERHVPVLFTAELPAGDVRAELVGSELPGGAAPSIPDSSVPDMAASSPSQIQPARNPVTANPNSVPNGIPGIPGITITPNSTTPDTANPTIPGTRRTTPNTAPNTAPNVTPNTLTALPAGLPFTAGEQLNFNLYLENAAQSVGTASFQVGARSKYFGRDGLLLTSKVETTGAAKNITDNDQTSTYVDPNTLLPFRFELALQEQGRRSNQTVTIDQDRGNATTETGTRLEIPVGTYDMLSVFYALRSFNLKSSKPNAVSLLIANRPRTLFITFLKRETIELGGQQIPAWQLSLTTDDAEADKNALRLWVSEDQRRLPLRLTAVTPAGRVRADLAIIPIVRQ